MPRIVKELANILDMSCELNKEWCIKLNSCIWDLSNAWGSQWRDKMQRIVLYKMKLQKLQENVVIYTKWAEDSAARLKDRVVVQESKHYICHAKFIAVNLYGDWMAANPEGLGYFCDLTACDLPGEPLFAGFHDHRKVVEGIVIKCRAKLGTQKSDRVGEKGVGVCSFRSDL